MEIKELENKIAVVKEKLFEAVQLNGLSLADPTIVQISVELDELITQYQKIILSQDSLS